MKKELHEANRLSWNAATVAHNSHKGDQAAFFRADGSTLFPEETALLGDVKGLALLHLQCNAGQDTLSIARLGAKVTGVDISDEAVAFATRLSAQSGIPARFERSDVYDYFRDAGARGERYDIVFCSYGTLCWLSDISAWARGVAQLLEPGGRFVFIDFHPYAMVFDETWQFHYDYFNDAPVPEAGVGDYVVQSGDGLVRDDYEPGVQDFRNPNPSFEFAWGVGEVITALAEAGLAVERFDEYPYANGWKPFEGMRDIGGKRMAPPESMPRIPLMYSLVARRPKAP
ncbi:class I SAM-dependent methyltransferase [Variovorax sp. ZS18.2.2]|uniref:class I SAM-dependent methyltransferase n=1 Tax=Variovorax sp. ZS18.2.2 TaxID=2971255 RepID=UPI002151B5ED|nr:class I SAM-dependent methyltransferase [Variovorax sp. ZS18.2.2]MCR6475559.1 class I SAM-dependent methyltransferase [Variovorax sp. ZS18.2.2]